MKVKILPRKNLHNPQIDSYTQAIERGMRSQHVVRAEEGWAVKKASAAKPSKVFSTQREAVSYGRNIASKEQSALFVHGKNGRIRERSYYGKDTFPPKGK